MRVEQRSLRVQRWLARAPKLAVFVTAGVLSVAGARSIAAGEKVPVPVVSAAPLTDLAAAGFAETFARAYLNWDADRPEQRDRLVASLSSEIVEPGSLRPADGESQHVSSASAILQERRGRTVLVTVAVAVEDASIYLVVPVARDEHGLLFVSAPPAIVGPPVAQNVRRPVDEDLVEDPGLVEVATRAVRNYLARERTNLIADLAEDAVVALPDAPLEVGGVDAVTWVRRPTRVAVLLDAAAGDATRMTLRYELNVVDSAGRWLVRSIGTNPSSKEAVR